MEYLYSLYDALVSINVPSDKARAVVDAMERDMGTTLATKQDLLLIRQEVENRYELLSRDIGGLRTEVGKDIGSLRIELGSLRASMEKDQGALRAEMAAGLKAVRADMDRGFDGLRKEFGSELALVRKEFASEFAAMRKEFGSELALVRKENSSEIALVRKDMETMRLSIIGWLGSGLVAGVGVILAAMRLWLST
ncbi:MAG: CCDC90 family protein [Steroidobacteraceae bacterium]|jgi:hypothetical protein|nr:CCDC90 family protein [Steroidobacteraceae bacterium]